MNTLSWLLYLSEVAGSARNMAILLGMFGTLFGSVMFVSGRLWSWDEYFISAEKIKRDMATRDTVGRVGRNLLITAAFCTLIAVVTPSKQTIYLVAASQAGEVVVKSEEAKEIMTGLKDIIKDQIAKNLPKSVKGSSE